MSLSALVISSSRTEVITPERAPVPALSTTSSTDWTGRRVSDGPLSLLFNQVWLGHDPC